MENTEVFRNIEEDSARKKELKRFIRVFFGRKIVLIGLIFIVLVAFAAIFASVISPYNPYKQDLSSALQQPSMTHLLGTDNLGRDTLSRMIYGSRTSLVIGLVAIGLAASIGMTMGLLAGYLGGITNTIIMRIVDALMSIPMILKALLVGTLLGGRIK